MNVYSRSPVNLLFCFCNRNLYSEVVIQFPNQIVLREKTRKKTQTPGQIKKILSCNKIKYTLYNKT